jgi:hypothetical protein
MFVGFGIDAQLAQHRLHLGHVGRHQVLARHVAIPAAAQRFAIEGEGVGVGRQTRRDPAAQGGFHRRDIQNPQEARQGGLRRGLLAAKTESMGQGHAIIPSHLRDGFRPLVAQEKPQRKETEHGAEGMASAVAAAGVWDIGEEIVKSCGGHEEGPPFRG